MFLRDIAVVLTSVALLGAMAWILLRPVDRSRSCGDRSVEALFTDCTRGTR